MGRKTRRWKTEALKALKEGRGGMEVILAKEEEEEAEVRFEVEVEKKGEMKEAEVEAGEAAEEEVSHSLVSLVVM